MNAYKKHLTIEESGQVVLSDLPFQPGQRVEVIVIAQEDESVSLAQKFKQLLKETQALHTDQPLTEEEINEEIVAYRHLEKINNNKQQI